MPERVLEPGGSHGRTDGDGVGRRDFFRSARTRIDPRSWHGGSRVGDGREAEPFPPRRIAK